MAYRDCIGSGIYCSNGELTGKPIVTSRHSRRGHVLFIHTILDSTST